MKNILKLLLLVLFIEITFESIISTFQMDDPLQKEIKNFDYLVRKQNKPLKTIYVTKEFFKCLNEINLPYRVYRVISMQTSITVTNDYEYIFPPYYNDTIRQTINNQIKECSKKNKREYTTTRTSDTKQDRNNNSDCSLSSCIQCIINAKIEKDLSTIQSLKLYYNNVTQYFLKIILTINNLLSKFEEEPKEYNTIKQCIIDSGCKILFL